MEALPALCDTHLHLFDLLPYESQALQRLSAANTRVISSCHTAIEVQEHANWLEEQPKFAACLAISFGIHPQKPVWKEADFLQNLINRPVNALPRLVAIGECGYDFFQGRSADGLQGEIVQDEIFHFQVELAITAGLPLVIHLRKATDLMFRHAKLLAKLPAVIFHSWPSPPEEGHSLLAKGVNAFFSLGTPLLQGKKQAQRSLLGLPHDRILMETDAPYQTLKNQDFTGTAALELVYRQAALILNQDFIRFATQISQNFDSLFGQAFAI